MIETITLMLVIVFIIMLVLLGIFIALQFKSKNKNEDSIESSEKNTREKKNYSEASIFDFMEFDKIEDNMIISKDGRKYVMVIECKGINYDLMSEEEKNAVEEGFIQFLNTLRHPIQIYTQTRTINLENSIRNYRTKVNEIGKKLEEQKRRYEQMANSGKYTEEELNATFYELTKTTNLYEYGKDIIYNTEMMSLNKNVLNQKYYIVIPYFPDELGENELTQKEIKNLAFSELYTRAQSIIRTLSVCEVGGRVLDSDSLADLLYVAYNRDDAEIYGIDKAIRAGYNELYSTAPDILDKKMKTLDEEIEAKAFEKASKKIEEAREDKQKEISENPDEMENIIDQLAQMIMEVEGKNKKESTKETIEDTTNEPEEHVTKKRGRPKKQNGATNNETKEDTTKNTKKGKKSKQVQEKRTSKIA